MTASPLTSISRRVSSWLVCILFAYCHGTYLAFESRLDDHQDVRQQKKHKSDSKKEVNCASGLRSAEHFCKKRIGCGDGR